MKFLVPSSVFTDYGTLDCKVGEPHMDTATSQLWQTLGPSYNSHFFLCTEINSLLCSFEWDNEIGNTTELFC